MTRWKEPFDIVKHRLRVNYFHYGVRDLGISAFLNVV
jgi:hypothetical protein